MFGPRLGVRTLEAALRDLQDEQPGIRQAAARDLSTQREGGRAQAIEALCGALDDEFALVRAAAALALADLDAEEAVELLCTRCQDEDPEVRAMALTALGELAAPKAASLATDACNDDQPRVRFAAVIAAVRCCAEFEQALDTILDATHDDDSTVAHIALRMSEELGNPDSTGQPVADAVRERARELLEHDASEVRLLAAVILGRCGDPCGAEILLEAVAGTVGSKEVEDEAAAMVLCGELGLSEAVAALSRRAFGGFLGVGGDPFAWQARVALAALGHGRAQAWILSELKAWNRERRTMAVAAATQAKLHCAIDLIRAMDGDSSRAEPEAVAEALSVLLAE